MLEAYVDRAERNASIKQASALLDELAERCREVNRQDSNELIKNYTVSSKIDQCYLKHQVDWTSPEEIALACARLNFQGKWNNNSGNLMKALAALRHLENSVQFAKDELLRKVATYQKAEA